MYPFQSLIGILMNCNATSKSFNLYFKFQSLIGILMNCNDGHTPGAKKGNGIVSIPNRDFDELQ